MISPPIRLMCSRLPFVLIAIAAWPSCVFAQSHTYEADIRPILKAHCFQCHGESGEKKGGLDLRLRRLMVSGGDTGAAIVPGKPEDSVLVERIRAGEMPPGDDKRLSAQDIAVIEQWIAGGAATARAEPDGLDDAPIYTEEERDWWSFRPIVRPTLPCLPDASVASNAVDLFLLSRLAEEAVRDPNNQTIYRFARPAIPSTLVRRASFDLLGLPSSPGETEAFINDQGQDGWARMVDRLLASPRYGERWGRFWLDVAGYADSEGYTDEDLVRPHAFHFRDYVIAAFNTDKPFDQFIIEQLAGDELVGPAAGLSAPVIEKLTATGFLRMAPDGTATSGIDQDLARNQVIADTVQIVGTSLLGLTINCAQCHDHRYDPISQADYYRFRAIFEPAMDWKKWKTPAARQISLYTEDDRQERSRLEADAKQVDVERKQIAADYIASTIEQELLLVADALREDLRSAYRTVAAKRTAAQKKLLNDHPSIANVTEGSLYLYDRRRDARVRDVKAKRAEKLQAFIAAATARELEKIPVAVRAPVKAALETDVDRRSPEQVAVLAEHPSVVVSEKTLAMLNPAATSELAVYDKAAAEISKARIKQHLQKFTDKAANIRMTIPPEPFVRALRETAGPIPATFVFHRGDHDQPKQQVLPAGLSVLKSVTQVLENDPSIASSGRRLRFAKNLTDGRHPLVARVIVNRIWMHHFGRGLVNSPSDFGVLGERPSHPELLDWLAVEFMESGWSVKHLHRLIMTSAAYQQTSEVASTLALVDPENQLYARMSVRRLDADALRDAVLIVSGKMNHKLFGEPVPVMEDEVGQIVIGRENLDGERKPTKAIPLNGEEFRRSVYVQARRSRPLAVFDAFDAPAMTPNCDRRATSNVAPQALLLMNSDFVATFSQSFADRLMAEAGQKLRDPIVLGWQLAYGSVPGDDEVVAAKTFVEMQQQAIQQNNPKTKPAVAQQQALASFCHALLSSNRFLYVE
jgi:hypothetical protein